MLLLLAEGRGERGEGRGERGEGRGERERWVIDEMNCLPYIFKYKF